MTKGWQFYMKNQGTTSSLRFILWQTWISVQNFTAIHPVVVRMFLSVMVKISIDLSFSVYRCVCFMHGRNGQALVTWRTTWVFWSTCCGSSPLWPSSSLCPSSSSSSFTCLYSSFMSIRYTDTISWTMNHSSCLLHKLYRHSQMVQNAIQYF